jgi:hypothetical protein
MRYKVVEQKWFRGLRPMGGCDITTEAQTLTLFLDEIELHFTRARDNLELVI